ncbi:arsenate reductase [Ereboglobus sp. PH5-10]|uniref:arsenate reductase ArsC n=1 Tax=Ereboglobus sp. PH5-10 TaxID=2940629 RepID=UPI0024073C12|nr:arsenate reductase ArsC [Ereboglobus sp. PH5-10]MDF9828531.1 arsenate reductase [Ereboglobus sp. PH5-10]
MNKNRPSVLVLCTGNSCRSQMAEGFLRAAAGDIIDVYSAGSKPAGHIHPLAVQVMREAGIDLSAEPYRSKSWNEFLNKKITTVITVCGNADAACPFFPGQVNRHHWRFDDPACAVGTDEEILAEFRRIRDQINLVFSAYAAGLHEGNKGI